MGKDPLLKLPVEQRRGCWRDDCGNTWEAVLFAGGCDAVAHGLARVGEIGLVKSDVTSAVLGGSLPAPDGHWALLVELAGSNWVHFVDPATLNPFTRDFNLAERLSKESGLKMLRVGYQDTAGATYVELRNGDARTLWFESTGEDFGADSDMEDEEFDLGPTRFQSDRHPADWWKQFDQESEAQQALVRDLDAYIPLVQAWSEKNGKIVLGACHEDAISPSNVRRIELVVFGPTAAAEPNAASKRLLEAIESSDAAAAEGAIRDGADLHSLPGLMSSPLCHAIHQLGKQPEGALAVIKSLLAAGADANGGAAKADVALIEAVGEAKRRPREALEVINLLLDAGADVDKPGQPSFFGGGTALLNAVEKQCLATVMLLHQRGASLEVRDMFGKTPLQRAEGMLKSVQDSLDEGSAERIGRPIREIVDYLKRAESGEAEGDWRRQADADQAAFDSERRRMLAKGERFKQAMEGLGRQLKEAETEYGDVVRSAIQQQPDAIELASVPSNPFLPDPTAAQLQSVGYELIGDFQIKGMPGLRIIALVHPQENVYAAVYKQPPAKPWVDLVRFHRDGTTLTLSNAKVAAGIDAYSDEKRFKKVFLEGKGVKDLIASLKKRRINADKVQPITATEFVDRFQKFYADDIAAKKARSSTRRTIDP
jgi:hypothetical protein